MKNKIENLQLRSKIANVEEAALLIKDGMTVAMGGYTSSGYPKVIANELAKRKMNGETFKVNLITGSNIGPIDTLFAKLDLVNRRVPMIESKDMAMLINKGKVNYIEQQMNKMPQLLHSNSFGKIDVAIIEALKITKEGNIVPTSSVGMIQHFVNLAESVIIEINVSQPEELEGMHDIYNVGFYPNRNPIPITSINERIGEPFIRVNPDKVQFIVKSEILDTTSKIAEPDDTSNLISSHLFNFLELETSKNKNKYLPPIQTGFGNLASAIVRSFEKSSFKDIEFFCGILQESNMELITKGKVKAASTGSIHMTPKVIDMLKQNKQIIKETVVLRNNDVTNNSEVINRFGLISLISGIEVDIYGNVNSSHIGGTRVVNGLGGGANFAQNAGLSIMLLPSETKDGDISTIVPMVTHHDIGEHDIDVVITENGVADLRGKSDVEKAYSIINNCANTYKEQLLDYFKRAVTKVGGHHPQLLSEVFSWHQRLKETGSMKQNQIFNNHY
ncbi:acetyl-CoA hydrolase [Caldibacillus lycopersici]|uniref:Acetyl-CoA hydrolase n=1 Tax=Perspicuibacillus lycopersici TaxID=1325689 RepID=A0AAE3IUW0_9BACI|nr:acetyl-CoA hydrolase/transferase C-terminal domain-containing protein [Perspicuibacillus lycopersici]MCU9614887.1 acetyl-CoA hydrolase [Perspicuibacillus lycopersici]